MQVYRNQFPVSDDEHSIFINRDGYRLSKRTIQSIVKKYSIAPIGAKLDDIQYLSNIITNMCNAYCFDYDKWYDF